MPKEVFDGIRDGTANHRAQFYIDITMPVLRLQPPRREGLGRHPRQLVAAGHDGRSQRALRMHQGAFRDRLLRRSAAIDVPVLVMHGEDDQICPFPTTGAASVKLLKHGTLKSYPGLPHGMPTTHADIINADLLEFIRS